MRLIEKASCSHTSEKWSFKCNSPGRHYAFLIDSTGQIRKVWGGYSPKIYDGSFLEFHAKWFEKALAGAEVIADVHFEWGTKNFKKVTFITPIPEPRGRRKKDPKGKPIPKSLTKEQKAFSAHVHSVRSRVENTFGRLKHKIDALSKPWKDGEQQLDFIVWFAAGLLNSP